MSLRSFLMDNVVRRTTVYYGFVFTAEDWKKYNNESFDRAKKLSDFVGIIVRLGFVFFMIIFFWNKARTTGGLRGVAFFSCAAFTGIFILAYIWEVLQIIVGFFMIDSAHRTNLAGKTLFVVLALALSSMIYFGVWQLAVEIARASAVLR